MDKQGKGAGVLSEKEKFGTGQGNVEQDRAGEQRAKEELAHMGEKTREGQHQKSSLQGEKK